MLTNQNKRILSQESSKGFINELTDSWDSISADNVSNIAKRYDDLDASLVKCMTDAKTNGSTIKAATDSYVAQGSAVNNLKGAFSGLGSVAGKALSMIGNALVSMGVSFAVSLIVQGIQNVINSYDDLVAKVGEITAKYTEAQGTLDDYSSKIVNIRTKLEDESTTTEEAAQMTAELYNIQNDLIGTYGAYAAGLDLVNGKLEDQVGILKQINQYNLQQWENEVNAERSNASNALNLLINAGEYTNPMLRGRKEYNFFSDWISGKSFGNSLKDAAFGEEDIFGIDAGNILLGSSIEQISKKFESFSDVIKATDNEKINSIIDSFEEFEVVDGKIKIAGSVDEVSDAVTRLQMQLSDLGYENKTLNADLVNVAKDTQDIITSSGDSYNTFVYSQIMHSDDLIQKYIGLTEAYNNYKTAQESGDQDAVNEALDTYLDVIGDIENSGIDKKYINYFESMHEELQGEISNWKLEFELLPKIKDTDLADYIGGNSYEEIFSDYLKWGQEDIDLPDSIENYFDLLSQYADDAGISVMQLISLLQQLDSFDYSKAEAKLKKASNGADLSTELREAAKDYYDAVAQYEKVGANRDTFNSGNVDVGSDKFSAQRYETTDGFRLVYTPYVTDPFTGEQEKMTPEAVNDYINTILERSTDETGKIDWDLALEIDAAHNGIFMAGGQGFDTQSYIEEADAINNRIIAFRNLYNAANEANVSVEEVKESFSKGLNWDDAQIASFLDSLDEDDLSTFLTLDLDDISKAQTEEEILQMIEDAQAIADENPIELKAKTSDLVEDLDTLEDKWDSLSTAYTSSVTNGETISATDLQSVTDDFGGIGADDNGKYNALSSALEKYNEELVKNPGDTTVAQNAADKLATAYLDLTGTLEDLIEEDADYAEEVLKANGVENAHEVVTSRLGKVYKGTRKNLENLAEAVAQWSDNLNATDQSSQQFLDGLDGIRESVSNLIALYDENGEVIESSVPELDNSFLIDNLEDIKLATEGDVEALDRLYVALARVNAEQVYVDAGLDTSDFSSDLAEIESLVAYANTLDIENDAYINDSQFMATLQKLLSSSSETASAVEAALSSIGVKISYKTTPKKIKVATDGSGSHATTVYGGANAGKTVSWDYVDVDEFEVVATKTGSTGSSGTGVKNYGGSSGSSSSSGGGSGDSGGSDDTSTDEETFDWVEVKIDRLEEQLSRLDEAIDDVYDNWGNRNDKISEKIKTVTDEIETQKDASKRYLEEANKYADLIGKEYVEKVQNGEIDIETIKVETSGDDDSNTLIENIQEYQTWYEKYIEASDQVNTLSRELNSYYKDLFDNVESQYEDLLDEIEKKTSIIEERITRTEEHGFFVDEAYYTQLLELEKSNYTDLEKEREELITKLNDAVTTGKIKQGSEAWYEMYLAIQDVNKAIEESMTNTVKLNNEIRQLAWDRFDWIEDRMNDFAEEADFLIGLLQGEETLDDRGNFNNRGYANAALIGAKYDDALAEAQRYADAIKEIDKDLATKEGKYDKNLIERKEELVSAYRSAIEAAEDEKQAMKSLVEEGVKKHLEYLSKLIDKYKDALSTMKSTYEYAKNINDQTKNISNLEKQLAAYQGDTSEEARKKRQELQNQLNSAQQQLEETQWDKYITETGEMLDNLYNDYETYLNDKLSSVTELMTSMIDMINQGTYTVPGAVTLSMSSIIAQLSGNGSIATAVGDTTISIEDGMDEIKNEYGITTQKFEDFGNIANGTKDILSAWSNGKYTNESTFVSKLDEVKNKFSEVTNGAADTIKKAIIENSVDIVYDPNTGKVGTVKTYNPATGNGSGDDDKRPDDIDNSMHITDVLEWGDRGWYQREGMWHYRKDDGSDITSEWYQDEDSGWWYYFDPGGVMAQDQFVEGYWLDDDGHMMPDKFQWHGDDSSGWWFGTKDGSQYVKGESVYIDGKWYDFDENGWMKYASGSRSIPTNRLAWTQDEGQELIYRTTDGALLTPLNQGDMVFTNEMSQRLWEIASGQIPIGGNIELPIIGGGTTAGNVTANNNITIELPNVENYDDFKKAMKQDRDLEKFWQEITIGQMMGNARLKKNKY